MGAKLTTMSKIIAVLVVFAVLVVGGLLLSSRSNPDVVAFEKSGSCRMINLAHVGDTLIDVPNFCVNGLCTVLVWQDAIMGPYAGGFLPPVYYSQSEGRHWIGGPVINLGMISRGSMEGTNGDQSETPVFRGGETINGGYIRIYDDSPKETEPSRQWTASWKRVTKEQGPNRVKIFICPR